MPPHDPFAAELGLNPDRVREFRGQSPHHSQPLVEASAPPVAEPPRAVEPAPVRDVIAGEFGLDADRVRSLQGRASSAPIAARGGARLVEAVSVGALLGRVRALEPGEIAMLPDGGAVQHRHTIDGRAVWAVAEPLRWRNDGLGWAGDWHETPEAATAAALTASARRTSPHSVGGVVPWRRHDAITEDGSPATFHGVDDEGNPQIVRGGAASPVTAMWTRIVRDQRVIEAAATTRDELAEELGLDSRRVVEAQGGVALVTATGGGSLLEAASGLSADQRYRLDTFASSRGLDADVLAEAVAHVLGATGSQRPASRPRPHEDARERLRRQRRAA